LSGVFEQRHYSQCLPAFRAFSFDRKLKSRLLEA